MRAREERQDPGTGERQQDPDASHVHRSQKDHTRPDTHRPVTIAGADRLPDERGARQCDAKSRHVGDRGQYHDHLRSRSADRAETHLHHLEDRKAEQVRRRQQPHRKSEAHLLTKPACMRLPGQMRFVPGAIVSAEKYRQREHQTERLRNGRGPARTGNAPPEAEDEQLVESHVRDGRDAADQQRHPGPPDAVEEAEHRPHRRPERGSRDTREPERRGEALDLGVKAEGRQNDMARGAGRQEQGNCAQRAPQRCPGSLGGPLVTACAVGLSDDSLHRSHDTAEHQHDDQNEPLHGADRRERLRRDVADEPHVRKIQHDLHAAVRHQRQRERQDGPLIYVRAPRGIDSPCRQSWGGGGGLSDDVHGGSGSTAPRVVRAPLDLEVA